MQVFNVSSFQPASMTSSLHGRQSAGDQRHDTVVNAAAGSCTSLPVADLIFNRSALVCERRLNTAHRGAGDRHQPFERGREAPRAGSRAQLGRRKNARRSPHHTTVL